MCYAQALVGVASGLSRGFFCYCVVYISIQWAEVPVTSASDCKAVAWPDWIYYLATVISGSIKRIIRAQLET